MDLSISGIGPKIQSALSVLYGCERLLLFWFYLDTVGGRRLESLQRHFRRAVFGFVHANFLLFGD